MEDRFKFRVVYYNDVEKKYFIFEPDLISADGTARAYAYGESGADEYYDTVTLNQSTGLKDKNGKLIYEGDIVKFGEFYDNEWNSFDIGKVYWGGKFDYPAFELQCSTVDFDMSNGLSYIFGSGLNTEIIGNIYENPELLEVENDNK